MHKRSILWYYRESSRSAFTSPEPPSRLDTLDRCYMYQPRKSRKKGTADPAYAKIYTQANCVLVWFGEKADGRDFTLEAIHSAADSSLTYQPNEERSQETNQDYSLESNRKSEGESSQGSSPEQGRESINKVLQRPWFRRIWVKQHNNYIPTIQ